MANFYNFYRDIFNDIVFPKQCLNCRAFGLFFCKDCRKILTTIVDQRCIICQQPSKYGFTHLQCQNDLAPTSTPDRLITIFDYHDPLISKAFNTAKLGLVSELIVELAEISCKKLIVQDQSFTNFVFCPIPLTRFKKRFRGFNQSELITQIFAQKFNLPIDQVLIKSRSTKQQKLLNKERRGKNLENSFSVTEAFGLPSHVLLIDDVCTTGSTFIEAAKVLKQMGIKQVWCLALAQD